MLSSINIRFRKSTNFLVGCEEKQKILSKVEEGIVFEAPKKQKEENENATSHLKTKTFSWHNTKRSQPIKIAWNAHSF